MHKERVAEHFIKLNNGINMPMLGYGTLQITNDKLCEQYIYQAIRAGYRMFDTAAAYHNEEAIGRAIARAIRDKLVKREELFLITKLWIQDAGLNKTRRAVEESMRKLQVEYLDLYLIHQPFGDYYGAWRVMEQMLEEGVLRSIGVCNFSKEKLVDLCINSKVIPAVNQIEIHPFYIHDEELKVMKEFNIAAQAWAPLSEGQRDIFNIKILKDIGDKYGKSTAQVILRWHIQRGISAIPRTVQMNHLHENIDIWDFELSDLDIKQIESLNIGCSEIIDLSGPCTAKWLNQWKIH
ncbi:aldo/keto reductase [Clostridium sp. 1001271B_151109_B4]|uniref:aldo/keto reductase n=1 Tax=Clostridium sp. 1001271B_151109_B4 TaxID=2787148 RepID=UPI0018A913F3|nr:aldo/keto reductase [Clostridium sp. 1001271B_151109_B4]